MFRGQALTGHLRLHHGFSFLIWLVSLLAGILSVDTISVISLCFVAPPSLSISLKDLGEEFTKLLLNVDTIFWFLLATPS